MRSGFFWLTISEVRSAMALFCSADIEVSFRLSLVSGLEPYPWQGRLKRSGRRVRARGSNFGERRQCEVRRIPLPRSRVNSYPWIGPGCLTPSRAITTCAYRFYGSTVYRRRPSGILVAPTVVRSSEGDTVQKRKTRGRQPGGLGPRPWLHCRTAGTRWSPERGPKA